MPDFLTLSCPSCGGKLQITNDVERFACAHCGSEHVVRRGGSTVSLAPVVAGLRQVQAGVDKTASELAIKRFQEELISLHVERQRAAADLAAKLKSVAAELAREITDHDASVATRHSEWLPALIFVFASGGLGLLGAWAVVRLLAESKDIFLALLLIMLLVVVAVYFGRRVVNLGRPDQDAEQALAEAQHHADATTSKVRAEGEGAIRTIDARISKAHQELERHHQIVSQ